MISEGGDYGIATFLSLWKGGLR
jgi:hypothetical protein